MHKSIVQYSAEAADLENKLPVCRSTFSQKHQANECTSYLDYLVAKNYSYDA
jgi:hypothetical protein